jgi:hypothetical protein
MTDRETFKPWQPLPDLPDVLYCEALHDDDRGVLIELSARSSRTPVLRISFDSVIAYRNVNETYRHMTWVRTGGGLPTLLTVEGSTWLAWLRQESGGILDAIPVVHYAIYTPEDCIDIASRSPPKVERLNAQEL